MAFTQTVHKRVEPRSHVNVLDGLAARLRARPGVVFLTRLNIVLDEDSEKGFGLVSRSILIACPGALRMHQPDVRSWGVLLLTSQIA